MSEAKGTPLNSWQITAAALVVGISLLVTLDLLLLIAQRPTISRVIKDRVGSDPTPYWIGFLMGALTSHFTNW